MIISIAFIPAFVDERCQIIVTLTVGLSMSISNFLNTSESSSSIFLLKLGILFSLSKWLKSLASSSESSFSSSICLFKASCLYLSFIEIRADLMRSKTTLMSPVNLPIFFAVYSIAALSIRPSIKSVYLGGYFSINF